MKFKSQATTDNLLYRLALYLSPLYTPLTAHALTVNGNVALGGGGTSNETNVRVSTGTPNSQLSITNHTLNVSDFFRVGDGFGLGGSVIQTGGLVNYNQTIGGPGYNTSQFLLGHWNGGTNAASYSISAGELRVNNALTIVGWDGTGLLNVSGTGLVNLQELVIQRHNAAAGPSTVTVSGGTLNTTFLNMGHQRGAGAFMQSGGVVNVTGGNGARIGHWGAGANSSYTMTGGQLNSTRIDLGWDGGNSSFNASGTADVNVSGPIVVQRSSTLMLGGNADVDITGNLVFGGGRGAGTGFIEGNATVDANQLYIQNESNLTLRGDSTTNVNYVVVGDGWGNNTLPHPTLRIEGNATLNNTGNVSIGDASSRAGAVVQTGGAFNTAGNFKLGHWGGETSTYDISGGTLNLTGTNGGFEANGALTLGVDGTGIFNQSGGLVVAESVRLDARGATGGQDQYNLTGGTLALRAGGIAGNGNTGTYAVNFGGGTVRADESFSIQTPVTLTGTNGDTTFNTNGNNITTNQIFSGSGGIIKEGAGTLNMSAGGQTFTGGVTINGGVFNPTGGGWTTSFFSTGAGQRTITINNTGTLLTGSGAGGGAHDLGGLGAAFSQPRIIINEGGTWQLDREQYISANNLDLNGGRVFVGNNDLRLQGGTLQVGASPTGSEIAGNQMRIFGNVVFDVSDGAAANDLQVSTPLGESGGARSITKTGAGTMALTNTAAHTGSTTVSGGVLRVSGGGAITSTSGVVIGSSGAVTLDNGSVTTSGNLNMSAAGARLNLIQNGNMTVSVNTAWGSGTIFDDSLAGDSIFTEGDGVLVSTAGSILDLNDPGDVFDLVGTLDLSAGGTIDGFGIEDAWMSSAKIRTSATTFEMLLVDADDIIGNFSNWNFGPDGNAVGSAAEVEERYDFFLFERDNQLYLLAAIPEPGTSTLLAFGMGLALMRRRRNRR